jgi:hypothetical protein
MSMYKDYNLRLTDAQAAALKSAVGLGAFAERAAQLRTIIESQTRQGYGQLADRAQSELEALEIVAQDLLDMKGRDLP